MTEYSYSFDLVPIILIVAGFYVVYYGMSAIRSIFGVKVVAIEKKEDISYSECIFKIVGNSDFSIKNQKYLGNRIPDIEVINKILFLDGKRKRNLSRVSVTYNLGVSVFVDGKIIQ